MDEDRLKQAARSAAEILAQAKVTAARASQALDRGKEAGTMAATALSRARRAEVWAEAAIGRSREVDHSQHDAGQQPGAPTGPTTQPRAHRPGDDQVWRADALAWLRATRGDRDTGNGQDGNGAPADRAASGQTNPA